MRVVQLLRYSRVKSPRGGARLQGARTGTQLCQVGIILEYESSIISSLTT